MNNRHESSKLLGEIVDLVHDTYSRRHGIDFKAIAADTTLSSHAKRAKFIGQVHASLLRQGDEDSPESSSVPDYSALISTGGTINAYCPEVWLSRKAATAMNVESGSAIETSVETIKQLLGVVDTDKTVEQLEIALGTAGGLIAVGGTWFGFASSTAAAITAAATGAGAAVAASGGTAAAVSAAASAAAADAAATAGLGAAGVTSATESFAAWGLAVGAGEAGASWGISGLLYSAAAFIATPAGGIIIGALVAIAIAALVFWLLDRDRDVGAVIINNTDSDLYLVGGDITTDGIYSPEGAVDYFPGIYDYSDPSSPVFVRAGLPKRKAIVEDDTALDIDNCAVAASFFGTTKGGGSVSGFFTMAAPGASTMAVCFYDNPSVTSTGTYMSTVATSGSGSTASDIYDADDDARNLYEEVELDWGGATVWGAAKCDSKHGTDAYAHYTFFAS